MKLTSKPKPVNFRIVLNNTEITSIELLQRHFDFERFFVTDQTQFISWLKRKDKDRGDQIERIFDPPVGEINFVTAITQTMNIIYDPELAFKNMVDFVNFLYDNNENNCYEVVKSNFSNYISNQGKLLHKLFPIDSIPQVDKNLDNFFGGLNATLERNIYLSQLYYRHGNIEKSQKTYPSLWILDDRERKAIQAITSCGQLDIVKDIIAADDLTIIGAEFIFLCVIAYLSIHWKDNHCKTLSELIDEGPAFKPLRESIGGSLKKLINKKNPDFYKVFAQLGYTKPDENDPLFNEKLFLASFCAEVVKQDEMRAIIRKKNNYFPALFIDDTVRHESKVLQSQEEIQYPWLSHILDYHDNPMGLDGDDEQEDKDVREIAILAHQFKEDGQLMGHYFHFPYDLDPRIGNSSQRKHIKNIKSATAKGDIKNGQKFGSMELMNMGPQKVFGSGFADPPALRKAEREYLYFFKEVVNICNNLDQYIDPFTADFQLGGQFTTKAESLIMKYRNENQILRNEKLFVVAILLLIRFHNLNTIYENENEIKKLKATYIPLRSLFKDEVYQLNENDEKILEVRDRDELLTSRWLCNYDDFRTNIGHRKLYYISILKRWIANFIYYIE